MIDPQTPPPPGERPPLPAPGEIHRRWAVEQLGLSPDLSAAQHSAAARTALQNADFVPAEYEDLAIRILAGEGDAALTRIDAGRLELVLEVDYERQVSAFAREFFQCSSGERARRYAELHAACRSFPMLQSRLERLEKGLSVDFDLDGKQNPQVRHLAHVIIAQFQAAPPQAARMRREFLNKAGKDLAPWIQAAYELKTTDPGLTALAPDLMAGLTSLDLARQRGPRPLNKVREGDGSYGFEPIAILLAIGIGLGVVGPLLKLLPHGSESSRVAAPSKPKDALPAIQLPKDFGKLPPLEGLSRDELVAHLNTQILIGNVEQQEAVRRALDRLDARESSPQPASALEPANLPPDQRPWTADP